MKNIIWAIFITLSISALLFFSGGYAQNNTMQDWRQANATDRENRTGMDESDNLRQDTDANKTNKQDSIIKERKGMKRVFRIRQAQGIEKEVYLYDC